MKPTKAKQLDASRSKISKEDISPPRLPIPISSLGDIAAYPPILSLPQEAVTPTPTPTTPPLPQKKVIKVDPEAREKLTVIEPSARPKAKTFLGPQGEKNAQGRFLRTEDKGYKPIRRNVSPTDSGSESETELNNEVAKILRTDHEQWSVSGLDQSTFSKTVDSARWTEVLRREARQINTLKQSSKLESLYPPQRTKGAQGEFVRHDIGFGLPNFFEVTKLEDLPIYTLDKKGVHHTGLKFGDLEAPVDLSRDVLAKEYKDVQWSSKDLDSIAQKAAPEGFKEGVHKVIVISQLRDTYKLPTDIQFQLMKFKDNSGRSFLGLGHSLNTAYQSENPTRYIFMNVHTQQLQVFDVTTGEVSDYVHGAETDVEMYTSPLYRNPTSNVEYKKLINLLNKEFPNSPELVMAMGEVALEHGTRPFKAADFLKHIELVKIRTASPSTKKFLSDLEARGVQLTSTTSSKDGPFKRKKGSPIEGRQSFAERELVTEKLKIDHEKRRGSLKRYIKDVFYQTESRYLPADLLTGEHKEPSQKDKNMIDAIVDDQVDLSTKKVDKSKTLKLNVTLKALEKDAKHPKTVPALPTPDPKGITGTATPEEALKYLAQIKATTANENLVQALQNQSEYFMKMKKIRAEYAQAPEWQLANKPESLVKSRNALTNQLRNYTERVNEYNKDILELSKVISQERRVQMIAASQNKTAEATSLNVRIQKREAILKDLQFKRDEELTKQRVAEESELRVRAIQDYTELRRKAFEEKQKMSQIMSGELFSDAEKKGIADFQMKMLGNRQQILKEHLDKFMEAKRVLEAEINRAQVPLDYIPLLTNEPTPLEKHLQLLTSFTSLAEAQAKYQTDSVMKERQRILSQIADPSTDPEVKDNILRQLTTAPDLTTEICDYIHNELYEYLDHGKINETQFLHMERGLVLLAHNEGVVLKNMHTYKPESLEFIPQDWQSELTGKEWKAHEPQVMLPLLIDSVTSSKREHSKRVLAKETGMNAQDVEYSLDMAEMEIGGGPTPNNKLYFEASEKTKRKKMARAYVDNLTDSTYEIPKVEFNTYIDFEAFAEETKLGEISQEVFTNLYDAYNTSLKNLSVKEHGSPLKGSAALLESQFKAFLKDTHFKLEKFKNHVDVINKSASHKLTSALETREEVVRANEEQLKLHEKHLNEIMKLKVKGASNDIATREIQEKLSAKKRLIALKRNLLEVYHSYTEGYETNNEKQLNHIPYLLKDAINSTLKPSESRVEEQAKLYKKMNKHMDELREINKNIERLTSASGNFYALLLEKQEKLANQQIDLENYIDYHVEKHPELHKDVSEQINELKTVKEQIKKNSHHIEQTKEGFLLGLEEVKGLKKKKSEKTEEIKKIHQAITLSNNEVAWRQQQAKTLQAEILGVDRNHSFRAENPKDFLAEVRKVLKSAETQFLREADNNVKSFKEKKQEEINTLKDQQALTLESMTEVYTSEANHYTQQVERAKENKKLTAHLKGGMDLSMERLQKRITQHNPNNPQSVKKLAFDTMAIVAEMSNQPFPKNETELNKQIQENKKAEKILTENPKASVKINVNLSNSLTLDLKTISTLEANEYEKARFTEAYFAHKKAMDELNGRATFENLEKDLPPGLPPHISYNEAFPPSEYFPDFEMVPEPIRVESPEISPKISRNTIWSTPGFSRYVENDKIEKQLEASELELQQLEKEKAQTPPSERNYQPSPTPTMSELVVEKIPSNIRTRVRDFFQLGGAANPILIDTLTPSAVDHVEEIYQHAKKREEFLVLSQHLTYQQDLSNRLLDQLGEARVERDRIRDALGQAMMDRENEKIKLKKQADNILSKEERRAIILEMRRQSVNIKYMEEQHLMAMDRVSHFQRKLYEVRSVANDIKQSEGYQRGYKNQAIRVSYGSRGYKNCQNNQKLLQKNLDEIKDNETALKKAEMKMMLYETHAKEEKEILEKLKNSDISRNFTDKELQMLRGYFSESHKHLKGEADKAYSSTIELTMKRNELINKAMLNREALVNNIRNGTYGEMLTNYAAELDATIELAKNKIIAYKKDPNKKPALKDANIVLEIINTPVKSIKEIEDALKNLKKEERRLKSTLKESQILFDEEDELKPLSQNKLSSEMVQYELLAEVEVKKRREIDAAARNDEIDEYMKQTEDRYTAISNELSTSAFIEISPEIRKLLENRDTNGTKAPLDVLKLRMKDVANKSPLDTMPKPENDEVETKVRMDYHEDIANDLMNRFKTIEFNIKNTPKRKEMIDKVTEGERLRVISVDKDGELTQPLYGEKGEVAIYAESMQLDSLKNSYAHAMEKTNAARREYIEKYKPEEADKLEEYKPEEKKIQKEREERMKQNREAAIPLATAIDAPDLLVDPNTTLDLSATVQASRKSPVTMEDLDPKTHADLPKEMPSPGLFQKIKNAISGGRKKHLEERKVKSEKFRKEDIEVVFNKSAESEMEAKKMYDEARLSTIEPENKTDSNELEASLTDTLTNITWDSDMDSNLDELVESAEAQYKDLLAMSEQSLNEIQAKKVTATDLELADLENNKKNVLAEIVKLKDDISSAKIMSDAHKLAIANAEKKGQEKVAELGRMLAKDHEAETEKRANRLEQLHEKFYEIQENIKTIQQKKSHEGDIIDQVDALLNNKDDSEEKVDIAKTKDYDESSMLGLDGDTADLSELLKASEKNMEKALERERKKAKEFKQKMEKFKAEEAARKSIAEEMAEKAKEREARKYEIPEGEPHPP